MAISLGALRAHPLAGWINDALLPLFFLIIGAEVKREFTKGALSTVRTAAFPLAGVICDIVVPLAVYLAFTYGAEEAHGWGTVITLDTAFALATIGLSPCGGRLSRPNKSQGTTAQIANPKDCPDR